jgi:hypothetical protein
MEVSKMRHPRVAVVGVVAMVFAGVSLASVAAAQTAASGKSTKSGKSVPRTSWGVPDLQGVWSTATVTPLERPEKIDKAVLTAAEVAEIEKRAVIAATDEARGQDKAQDVAGAYNDFWWDRGTRSSGRTSLIVDPPDGKMPPLTPEAKKYADSAEAQLVQETRRGNHPAKSYTDTDLWDRCLTRGLPMMSGPYNNNFQIFQTRDHVVILHEMIHDARIIPLDSTPLPSPSVTQWFGTARGRWEGDTLVVETKNFSPQQELPFEPRMTAAGMRLVERFTRVDDGTLNYEFTVDHPSIYSRPWTALNPMKKSDGEVFEYACHEGNYGIVGILSGSRAIDKANEEKARKGSR